jgi:hypothetical protein
MTLHTVPSDRDVRTRLNGLRARGWGAWRADWGGGGGEQWTEKESFQQYWHLYVLPIVHYRMTRTAKSDRDVRTRLTGFRAIGWGAWSADWGGGQWTEKESFQQDWHLYVLPLVHYRMTRTANSDRDVRTRLTGFRAIGWGAWSADWGGGGGKGKRKKSFQAGWTFYFFPPRN